MKLTWLGHSCFLAEQEGYTILLDPYTGVEGYPPLSGRNLRVNQVLCSHQHFDHNAVDQASLLPEAACPFVIRSVKTFHDDQGGALRGGNAIHILSAGGVSVAHLGDLGHQLSPEQIEAVGHLDAALVPVGGVYTVDARGAKAVCDALKPRCVIPMHYCHPPYGLPNIGVLEDFLTLWPESAITRLDGLALELTPQAGGVIVPKFTEEC